MMKLTPEQIETIATTTSDIKIVYMIINEKTDEEIRNRMERKVAIERVNEKLKAYRKILEYEYRKIVAKNILKTKALKNH
jgi:hypothetical protein